MVFAEFPGVEESVPMIIGLIERYKSIIILMGLATLIPLETLHVALFYKLGIWLILFNPYTLIFFNSVLIKKQVPSIDIGVILIGLVSLGFIISGVYNQSSLDSTLALAVFFIVQVFAAKEIAKNNLILKALVFSIGVYAALVVVSYIHYNYLIYFRAGFEFVSLENMLIYNRFIENLPSSITDHSKFHLLVSNTNKASNIFTLYALLVSYLYMSGRVGKIQSFVVMSLICLVQVVLFSRAALLVLFCIAGLLFLYSLYKNLSKKLILVFLVLPFLFSISTKTFRDYWMNIETISLRYQQQKKIVGIKKIELSDAKEGQIIFGMGPGGYGEKYYKTRDAGTHNFFLDIYLAGGIISIVSIVLFFIYRAFKNYKRNEGLGRAFFFSVLFIVLILAFREMDFLYLYRLGQFGFLFHLFYYVSRKTDEIKELA